ncbi:hypothetical protein ACHQM5_024213 [Ranunculus cassubicifolius]
MRAALHNPSIAIGSFSNTVLNPSRHFPSSLILNRPNSIHSSRPKNTANSPDYYERKSIKKWNDFYKRHQNKFFKDRHYLDKDWGHYFSSDSDSKVVLEVGCGAGNTVFPLIDAYPNLFIHACDFSPNAISLVKSHEHFKEDRVNTFVCDITNDDLCEWVTPTSVDIVTLIFALSAVSPKKMPLVLQNLKKVIKPGGHVLFRDYAVGDFAQEKLISKNQTISENFCVRGDGTCAFFFSEDFLSSLFQEEGFNTTEINIYCKEIVNRSRNIVMDSFSELKGRTT